MKRITPARRGPFGEPMDRVPSRHQRDPVYVTLWKRLKIVQGLINYRQLVQKRPTDDLFPIHEKLQEIVAKERITEEGAQSIEEVVGKINPREADVIQDHVPHVRDSLAASGDGYPHHPGITGHSDVKTTMIYTHVLNQDDVRVTSPLDRLVNRSPESSDSSMKQEAVAQAADEVSTRTQVVVHSRSDLPNETRGGAVCT